jgi:hypothetical protein
LHIIKHSFLCDFQKVFFWPGASEEVGRFGSELDLSNAVEGCRRPAAGGCSLDEFSARSEDFRPVSEEVIFFAFFITLNNFLN